MGEESITPQGRDESIWTTIKPGPTSRRSEALRAASWHIGLRNDTCALVNRSQHLGRQSAPPPQGSSPCFDSVVTRKRRSSGTPACSDASPVVVVHHGSLSRSPQACGLVYFPTLRVPSSLNTVLFFKKPKANPKTKIRVEIIFSYRFWSDPQLIKLH